MLVLSFNVVLLNWGARGVALGRFPKYSKSPKMNEHESANYPTAARSAALVASASGMREAKRAIRIDMALGGQPLDGVKEGFERISEFYA